MWFTESGFQSAVDFLHIISSWFETVKTASVMASLHFIKSPVTSFSFFLFFAGSVQTAPRE